MKRIFIFMFFIVAITSCVSTKIKSIKDEDFKARIDNIFILVNIAENEIDFGSQFLGILGIEFRKMELNLEGLLYHPMSLLTQKDIADKIRTFSPDFLLEMTLTKKTIQNGSATEGEFDLALYEIKSKKPIWKATVNTNGGFGSIGDPVLTVKEIIEKLRIDGLIKFAEKDNET